MKSIVKQIGGTLRSESLRKLRSIAALFHCFTKQCEARLENIQCDAIILYEYTI